MLQQFRHHPSDIHLVDESSAYPLNLDENSTLVIASQSAYKRNLGLKKHIPAGADVYVRSGGLPSAQEILDLPKLAYKRVIGIGGGSVMDVAKAYTALLSCQWKPHIQDLLENSNLMDSYATRRRDVELRLIPTLFGSSAELSRWSSLWFQAEGKKASLIHPCLYADHVVYDPCLCASASIRDIKITALDCLTHAVESCWHLNHNFITDHLALGAIRLSVQILSDKSIVLNGNWAQTNLAQATVFSGLAFSQQGTSIAHALSYPLTLEGLPHGLASSVFLGKLLAKFEQLRPNIHRQIITFFSQSGFTAANIEMVFNDFYACCGAEDLLCRYDISQLKPAQAATQASYYKKFDLSIIKLSSDEATGLYENLLRY